VLTEGGSVTPGGSLQSRVTFVAYEPELVRLHAEVDGAGYLVLGDAYYPGWEAFVDGEPTPILRANLYFRAVVLELGTHDVVFVFSPRSVRSGLTVGAAAWFLWIAVLVTGFVSTRRCGGTRV
jgi:uncharacterized membrane protein YfhO